MCVNLAKNIDYIKVRKKSNIIYQEEKKINVK
jgi:hypothetical protein